MAAALRPRDQLALPEDRHGGEHVEIVDAAGEFLVMAATLIELKSRALLPTPPLEVLEESDDPRASLVRQLLEYKRFKDAARALEIGRASCRERV